MTMASAADTSLARRLADQDPEALTELTSRFGGLLDAAFTEMQTDTPGCKHPAGALLNEVMKTLGLGFLETTAETPTAFAEYVVSVHLADLFWSAACVTKDDAAWRRFIQTVDRQIVPGLLKNWGTRVGAAEVRKIAAELPGHCLQECTRGRNTGVCRLATFRGRASLSSWLFVAAARLLQDGMRCLRNSGTSGSIEQIAVASPDSRPDRLLLFHEAEREGAALHGRLTVAIKHALEAMPPRRRLAAILHWVHDARPSEIAERMTVSRPRVTELLAEAKEHFRHATQLICQEIAAASNRSLNDVQSLLVAELGHLLN